MAGGGRIRGSASRLGLLILVRYRRSSWANGWAKVKTYVRRATEADYETFYGRVAPERWIGFLAQNGDEVVAFGYGWVDQDARTWIGIDGADKVPPIALHRTLLGFLKAARAEGIPAIYALCDDRIPKAAAWLTWLGFAIDATQPQVYMPSVDRSLPVWCKALGGHHGS
jgi:hypothetical protein